MLINRTVITAKIETTYGTDAAPAATDAILVQEPTPPASEGLRMNERPVVSANISPKQAIYGGRLATVSFKAEIKGSGTAGTAPELDALFQSCGFASTIVASTSVTYNPASTGHKSCTIYYYLDGTLHKLTGCRGTVSFALETGALPMASFTMTGHVSNPTDVSIVTPTYDSTVPAALVSVPFTIGGYSAVINALNFDMGTTIAKPNDISASDGYGDVQITAYKPTGSFDPENTLIATQDWYSKFTAGTLMALTTGVIGGTAGIKVKFDMPAIYYSDIGHADRDGVATLDTPYAAVDNSGDDFVSIAFT